VLALAAAVGAAAFPLTRVLAQTRDAKPMQQPVRFMTLDPGHFHAALVQKEMYPGVAPRVDVYAPLGPDLLGHLARIAAFNLRPDQPTSWQVEVHTGPDALQRMLADKPGNVVVLSGRNKGKIARIGQSVAAGLSVLADKPWILESRDLPALEAVLADADTRRVTAYDIMTERFETTSMLQRELVNDRATFGETLPGTADDPAVYMESVHHLMKVVSGAPNIRPTWFFDTSEQGEGLNDIGTHLVDLVHWTLFPDTALDYKADIRVLAAQRWPTMIPEADFRRVTGAAGFPASLAPAVKNGALAYDCNTLVTYRVRGIHTRLNVIWDWEAPAGAGDTHFAVYKGSVSRIESRQSKVDGYKPELYVVPNKPDDRARVLQAVKTKIAALAQTGPYAGVTVDERHGEIHVVVPDALRVGHEAHFAQVTRNFLRYLGDRSTLPAWERPNMAAKYFVTTTGAELSRQGSAKPAARIAP
jgi:predicted dehydrogenase